jgi:hypothetical protein
MANKVNKAEYLAQFMGGDLEKAQKFLDAIGVKKEALSDAGIENKAIAEGTTPDATATAAPETPPAEPVAKEAGVVLDQAAIEKIAKELGMDDLAEKFGVLMEAAEKVPLLEAMLKQQKEAKDEELAKMIEPPAARFPWMQKARASQDDKNVLSKEEQATIEKQKPHWLLEATGIQQ